MDITFHYFAVKTLARKAGFEEGEAQRIATYSQYIDEFDWITYLDCKNLPDYIKKNTDYDLYLSSFTTLNMNFNPAMTGFIGIIDMAFLALERTQKFTVSPFHFIPPDVNQIAKETRTVPAVIGNGSFISQVVARARDLLLAGGESRKISLMRLGMALHTFADTYAHQLFSGYNSWANDVKVISMTDNKSNADLTAEACKTVKQVSELAEQYQAEANGVLPCIGHMWAGHTPDLTNVSFEMKYKGSEGESGYSKTYVRSNTETFVTASKHILNLLRSCLQKGPIPENDWIPFAERLSTAFLIEFPEKDTETKLAAHWSTVFPEYKYFYSKERIEAGFYLTNAVREEEDREVNSPFGKNYTEEFYCYNYLADTLLIQMYGPHPRSSWWN